MRSHDELTTRGKFALTGKFTPRGKHAYKRGVSFFLSLIS